MFKKGDKVIVKTWGECYSSHSEKARELGLNKWIQGGHGLHPGSSWEGDKNVYIVVKEIDGYVGIQDVNGGQYVVGSRGLEITNSKQIKITNKQMKTAFILKDGSDLTVFETRDELMNHIDGDDCDDYEVLEVTVTKSFKVDDTPRLIEVKPVKPVKVAKKTAKRG